jgi:hypothetical protein
MRSYGIGAAYLVSGSNHRLSVARCQGVESKEEGRCR